MKIGKLINATIQAGENFRGNLVMNDDGWFWNIMVQVYSIQPHGTIGRIFLYLAVIPS
jgi:hypothetical protein